MIVIYSNSCGATRHNESMRHQKMFSNTHMPTHIIPVFYVCMRRDESLLRTKAKLRTLASIRRQSIITHTCMHVSICMYVRMRYEPWHSRMLRVCGSR